jgi:hypothetical protein
MNLQPVNSSNINAIGYDSDTQTLTVEFKSGGTYEYYDVPESEFESLRTASSVGQYFQNNIRGRYRYARL